MHQKIFLQVLFVCQVLFVDVYSQSSPQLPKIVGPSPNVAAIQRFGEIPVSSYTGVPNISIPIYSIQSDDLSVPVSIQYHASGIKVADEASRVGLGWALNAGGVISRTIVGADDFAYNGLNYHIESTPDIKNGPAGDQGPSFYIQEGCNLNLSGYSSNVNDFIRDGYDFQPDQYNFNFGGYSGKFILKRNKEAILQSKEKISIKCLDNDATAWQIITPDGVEYSFNEIETYTDNENTTSGGPSTHKSSWYLTRITSPKGGSINFYYTTALNFLKPIGSISQSENPRNPPPYFPENVCNKTGGVSLIPSSTNITPGKDYKTVSLSKIVFDDGELRFQYVSDRVDILNDLRLSKVQLFHNNYNPTSTQLLKEWELYQSYFVGTSDQDYSVGNIDQATKRLKLDSLKEKDANGNYLPAYSFLYNYEGNGSNYPAKSSFARDHWGYYNGKISNTSLIPEYLNSNSSSIVWNYLGILGENREVDPAYSQIFILKEIKYPTGGRTALEFEQNDFDYEKSKLYDHSFFRNVKTPKSKWINKIYNCSIKGEQPTTTDLPNKILDLTGLLIDPEATTAPVKLDAFFRFNTTQSSCNFPGLLNKVWFSLTKEDGTVLAGPTYIFQEVGGSFTECTVSGTGYIGIRFMNEYSLAPGKYIWKLHQDTDVTLLADVSLNLHFTGNAELEDIQQGSQLISRAGFAGGLRIRKITSYDNTTEILPSVKRYSYNFQGDDNQVYTAGIRMSRPVYSYFQKEINEEECKLTGGRQVFDSWQFRLMMESDSHIALNGSAGGSVVGYSRVEELIGEQGEYGKTVSYFENKADLVLNYAVFDRIGSYVATIPIRPPIFSSVSNPGNGNLLRKVEYKFSPNTFSPISEVLNTYTNFATSSSMWYGIEKRNYAGTSAPTQVCYFKNFIYPAIVESRNLLTSTTSISYDMNDEKRFVTNTRNFFYDQQSHLQLVRTEDQVGNNLKQVTSYTYPADYSDAVADNVIKEMKGARHMHNSVITKKVELVNGSSYNIIAGDVSSYVNVSNNILTKEIASIDLVQPVNTSTVGVYQPATGSFPSLYSGKVLFEDYDAFGNPLRVRKKDDISIAYLWDYNNTKPIAEVKNATPSDIAYTSFEADGTGNWSVPVASRDFANAITGNRSYNMVNGALTRVGLTAGKTYILSYWSRSGVISISGGTSAPVKQAKTVNGWTYYEHKITMSTTTLQVSTLQTSGTFLIDELRLYPNGAQMSTYTHEPLLGTTSECDINNRITYFEYDGFGRLLLIRDQDRNILKTFEYKYRQ